MVAIKMLGKVCINHYGTHINLECVTASNKIAHLSIVWKGKFLKVVDIITRQLCFPPPLLNCAPAQCPVS